MHRRTAYELSASQVTTPEAVVRRFWRLAKERRRHIDRVLDLGAGDGRFANEGIFNHYTGIEIDRKRVSVAKVPQNGRIIRGCAFRHREGSYDACVGNPPYVRHHDIESPWKEETTPRMEHKLGISLSKHCNLYLYFLCLAFLKTHEEGLIRIVITPRARR
jgi:methylase of polypeptide subunit release factors